MIGEDILVNVNHYDPQSFPDAIEDQGRMSLRCQRPVNKSHHRVAGIRRIVTRPVKITTIPPNKPISIGSINTLLRSE